MKLDYFTAFFQNASSIFMTFFILRSFLMSFLLTQKISRTHREEHLLKQEANAALFAAAATISVHLLMFLHLRKLNR